MTPPSLALLFKNSEVLTTNLACFTSKNPPSVPEQFRATIPSKDTIELSLISTGAPSDELIFSKIKFFV